MAHLTHLFPGLRDPLACAGLLLTVGLYTAALFLPSLRVADSLLVMGPVNGESTGLYEVRLNGWNTLLYALYSLFNHVERVWRHGWNWDDESFAPRTWLLWGWFLRGWLANLLLALGVFGLARGHRYLPWVSGGLALVCGASLELWRCEFDGYYSPNGLWRADLVGSYIWLASMAVLAAAGAYRALWPRDRARLSR